MPIEIKLQLTFVFIFQEESVYEHSAYDDSDVELEDRSRPHPIDETHRVTLRYDTEKHINPRTGEIIEGVKSQPADKNPLSYDVQNIEPVAPANVVRRYGIKEEGSSHSSTKDSAYGSMEVKVTSSKTSYKADNKLVTSLDNTAHSSPSRSLSGSSIQQNRSPLTTHAQRIQRSEEVFSKELEGRGSTSTLHSLGNSSRSNSLNIARNESLDSSSNINIEVPVQADSATTSLRPGIPVATQNGFSPSHKQPQSIGNQYVSMKNTVYDRVNPRNENPYSTENYSGNQSVDSPYTSMMNIVQGQMKISPHGNEINRNIVDVSVTTHNKKM